MGNQNSANSSSELQLKLLPGDVTSLRWTGKQLKKIPSALALLTNLRQLNVSSNYLTDITPATSILGALSKLTNLDLSCNQLQLFPDEIELPNLCELHLSFNSFSSFPISVGNFVALQILDLSHSSISGSVPSLASLESITSLNLSYNSITRLPHALGRGSLVTLDVSYNCLKSLPNGKYLSALRELDATHNSLNVIAQETTQALSQLRRLDLSHNQITDLPELNFPNLTFLSLRNNRCLLAKNELRFLTALTLLDLANNRISRFPINLSATSSLVHLNLCCNPLNGSPLPNFSQSNSSLFELHLGSIGLSTLPQSFYSLNGNSAGLRSLNQLFLGYNSLSQFPLASTLKILRGLRVLCLSGNRLNESSIVGVRGTTVKHNRSLKELYLGGNEFREFPDIIFEMLKGLEVLDLSCNRLSNLSYFFLDQRTVLQYLDLSYNPLPPQLVRLLSNDHNQRYHREEGVVDYCLDGTCFTKTAKKDSTGMRRNEEKSLPQSFVKHSKTFCCHRVHEPFAQNVGSYIQVSDTSAVSAPESTDPNVAITQNKSQDVDTYRQNERELLSNPRRLLGSSDKPKQRWLKYSKSFTKGKRNQNEDEIIVYDPRFLNGNRIDNYDYEFQLIGVLDGHAGRRCVNEVSNLLFTYLIEHLTKSADPQHEAAIKSAFEELNLHLLNCVLPNRHEVKPKQNGVPEDLKTKHGTLGIDFDPSGATAVICLIDRATFNSEKPNRLFVANVGDARAVLCRNDGTVVRLSVDHKPSLVEEQRIISQKKGWVTSNARVNGVLAVSRAFGDLEISEFISCVPHVQKVDLTPQDEYLVLASDGLWDVITDEMVPMIFSNPKPRTEEELSMRLRDFGYFYGSSDNISVVVVHLKSLQ